MSRLRMAVIGVGHLGKEHARILAGLPDVELVGVADVNADQAQAVARRCGTQSFADHRLLLDRVHAVTIAVPTTHHHAVGTDFLRHGIPLLIEKPLAADLRQAEGLVELAQVQRTMLQVGHIERFNPAFEELVRRPIQPKFIDCERCGPYSGRSTDIGAVLDLMIHDLDLVLALVEGPVQSVEAVGLTVLGGHEDVAHARLVFGNGCVATLRASRISTNAMRRLQVWGAAGFADVDLARRRLTLLQPSTECLTSNGQRSAPAGPGSASGNHSSRPLEMLELDRNHGDQLTREIQHFVHCVRTGQQPRVGGKEAGNAMALAARVLESIRTHSWEGRADGPTGPANLPPARAPLFQPTSGQAAA
jgi:predicted dehydrogenase